MIGLEPLDGTRVRLWFYDHDRGELDLSLVTQRRPSARGHWDDDTAAAAK